MSARVSFEDRCKELEGVVSDFLHDLWERGLSVTPDSAAPGTDHQAFVDGLARKLEKGLEGSLPRTSARTLTGIVVQVAAARLRTVISVVAGLSATERRSLATLLQLPEQERRTLGTILGLRREERNELARVLGLSNLECQVLAAFIGDQQAELRQELASPKPSRPAAS